MYAIRSYYADKTDGSGIPGVTIREAGTTNGTITDLDGKYTITVKSAEAKLIFSFVGYATTDKIVGLQKTINVALASSAENLDELVVVGYGVQKKADKTGAVALVKAADLVQGNLSDPVITSYSIHYTKLYERLLTVARCAWPLLLHTSKK